MALIVIGKNINLREVNISDAKFLLSLRTSPLYNKYLNKTDNDINKQIEYIKNNILKNDDFYFIVESKDGKRYGCIRIYNITEETCINGSWIITHDAPYNYGIESYFLIFDCAFYYFKVKNAQSSMNKKNHILINFYKRMGLEIVSEDPQQYHFHCSKEKYGEIRRTYKRFTVEHFCIKTTQQV